MLCYAETGAAAYMRTGTGFVSPQGAAIFCHEPNSRSVSQSIRHFSSRLSPSPTAPFAPSLFWLLRSQTYAIPSGDHDRRCSFRQGFVSPHERYSTAVGVSMPRPSARTQYSSPQSSEGESTTFPVDVACWQWLYFLRMNRGNLRWSFRAKE